MSRPIRADYRQYEMFPPCLEDWLPANHPTRFIRAFVEVLDLQALGFRQRPGEVGRPHYSDRLLLKAWIYGYLNRIRSSRELEKACGEHLSLIWLLGRHRPDHNTLWRFWKANQKGLRKLFRQVVRVACEANLVGVVLHALDGTRIEAVQSTDRAMRLKRLRAKLKQVDRYLDELEKEIEQAGGDEQASCRLSKKLEDERKLRELIRKKLEWSEKQSESGQSEADEEEPAGKGGKEQPADEEGKEQGEKGPKLVKIGSTVRLGYNAQVMVDADSQMIVAEEVSNDQTDYEQLVPLLEQTEQTLGRVAADTVADRGYRSDVGIGTAEKKHYSVLVQLHNHEMEVDDYHWSQFEYDEKRDELRCFRGQRLGREGGFWDPRRKIPIQTYRCRAGGQCPVVDECTRDPKGRKVRRSEFSPYVLRQRARQLKEENQHKLRRRKGIVERSFAEIKQHMGFRRWSYRKLEGVRTQWAMICTAYNLKRLIALWQQGELGSAAA